MADAPLLTLSEDEMRQMAAEVVRLIVDHFMTLSDKPVTRPSSLELLSEGLHEPLPLSPTAVGDLLEQLKTHVFADMTHYDHPRNFSFVPSPSNFVSAMADALASGLNVFCGAWIGPSGAAQIELTTIEWLRTLFRLPATAGGMFVSGGSMANMTGLAVARLVMLANNAANATVYFSDQTHSSVAKGLKILGFQQFQVRILPSDAQFRLPLDTLRQKIAADRAQGMLPFCVVANAGTTNTGAVDPLRELAAFCKAEGLWLHIDGAYGGSAAITDRGREVLEGIELADSLSIDPHKWMFQPYEIGCILVRDRDHLRDTFRVSAEYLKILEHDAQQVNFSDFGMQLTRNFRALKLWMSLKAFGVDAFKAAITQGMENAKYVESLLRRDPCWQVITSAQLGIITFRYVVPGWDDTQLNVLNTQMVHKLIHSGYAMLSPTILRGRYCLRMCTINPRTTEGDLEQTIALLRGYGDDLADIMSQAAPALGVKAT